MMKKLVGVFATVMMMSVPTMGIAAMAGANTVNSAAIVDGSIATADIANLAVTGAKIANGTVTAMQIANGTITGTQLANGAVTAAKLGIVCTTGQILQYTATGWVCSNGTTGPQGIQGPAGATGATPHYANVIVVAKSGGDFSDLNAAANSIVDASESNPYLIKLMPGVYELGATLLQVRPYVNVEGSGEGATVIRGNIRLVNNVELRHLTVDASAGGAAILILNGNIALSHITLTASGAYSLGIDSWGFGVGPIRLNDATIIVDGSVEAYGIRTQAATDLILNNCQIVSSNAGYTAGIESVWGAKLTVNNSSITAQGSGYINSVTTSNGAGQGADTIIRGSVLKAIPNTGGALNGNSFTNVVNTQLDGGVGVGGKCVGVYDANYNAISCGQ